jgi:rubrerythrin
MIELVRALEERRSAEKAQAVFYRALAAAAEESADEELAQRLHGLHADEQHHLSRLTARLVELGVTPTELTASKVGTLEPGSWEAEAREREEREIAAYESLLSREMDSRTMELIGEILEVERHHARELGGKWTLA